MAMATFSQEGGPPQKTQAEVTLQQLLDRQLSTTGRLELVDFKEATESMRCIGHASAGVASLAEFQEHSLRQRQADEKAWALRDLLQSKGLSDAEIKDHLQKIGGAESSSSPSGTADKAVAKRKRFGAHPDFMQGVEAEHKQLVELGRGPDISMERGQQEQGRHAAEIEASLLRRSDRPPAEVLVMGGRKPWLKIEQSELYKGTTPQERARLTEEDGPRTIAEVFASPAPPVLDMYTYLEQRRLGAPSTSLMSPCPKSGKESSLAASDDSAQNMEGEERENEAAGACVREVPEDEIHANRMSEEKICQLPGSKFANYAPGCPSHTVYIKNLVPDVTEADLVGLFKRFEKSGGPKLVFRLMQRGRMKGQAFVTFADKETAGEALKLANGYILKGKPMVIEFARGVKPLPASQPDCDPAPTRSRRRKATKDKHVS